MLLILNTTYFIFVEVKNNLITLDQWMAQMEVRLKPNYFRVNWNRREIRQKTEEHKVRFIIIVVKHIE